MTNTFTPEQIAEFDEMKRKGRYELKFTFATPDIMEAWLNRTGKFKTDPNASVQLSGDTLFKSGSVFSDGVEVARMVKPKATVDSPSIVHRGDQWAILRLWQRELEGHTFLREYTVVVMPAKKADHQVNGEFMIDRIRAIIPANIAEWNKARTILSWRREMKSYEKIYDITLPGISEDEAAFLTKMRIFGKMNQADIDKAVEQYEALYGKGCLGEAHAEV